jgi:FMN-dependent NADH-azoreductase
VVQNNPDVQVEELDLYATKLPTLKHGYLDAEALWWGRIRFWK